MRRGGGAGAVPAPWTRAVTRRVGTLVFLTLGGAAPLAAQAGPPTAGPLPELRLPSHVERALPGGATLVVVEQREQPWVAVHLAFPGGRLLEAPGREGTAGLMADLLLMGDRAAAAVREAERLGAELAVVAEDDAVHVRMALPSPRLEGGLRLLADLLRRPAFPAEQLRSLRERSAAVLEARLQSPDVEAGRAFLRAVYGDGHPYGSLETPASYRVVEREDLLRFHSRALSLEDARIVVVGDVDADSVEATLGRTLLASGEGHGEPGEGGPGVRRSGGAGAGPVSPPARRERVEVVIVHDPRTPVAVLEVGHVLPDAGAPEWPALAILGHVLDGRLARRFRARGWSHPVSARLDRRQGWSLLHLTARVPGALADSAATVLLSTLETLHTELVRPAELRRATDVLVGSFFLSLEAPEALADAVARSGLQGRPPRSLEGYAGHLSEPGPVELGEVARAHMPLSEAVIAVAGDAVHLGPALRPLGRVVVVDREGRPVDPAGLTAQASTPEWDASALEPVELVYRVSARAVPTDAAAPPDPGGRLTPLGEMRRTLERVPEAEASELAGVVPSPPGGDGGPARVLRFRTEMSWIGTRMRQEVTFTAPGFEPLAGSFSVAGRPMAASLRVDEDRVVGRVRLPDTGERKVDRPFPEGALMGEMQELALWLLEPEEGAVRRFRVVSLESGRPVDVEVRVLASEPVTVPAGRFDAWLLEVASGDLVQRVHVRREAPHVVLRLETPGQPVVVELELQSPRVR